MINWLCQWVHWGTPISVSLILTMPLHPSPGFTPQISMIVCVLLTGRIWHHGEQPFDIQPGPEWQPGEEDGDVWLHHGPHRGKSDTLVAITLCQMGFYFTCTSGKEPIVIVWKEEEPSKTTRKMTGWAFWLIQFKMGEADLFTISGASW